MVRLVWVVVRVVVVVLVVRVVAVVLVLPAHLFLLVLLVVPACFEPGSANVASQPVNSHHTGIRRVEAHC